MIKIPQFIFIILILCLAILLHSCGQMTAEDEGLDSKSIEEASGSTGITTDDTTTDDTTDDTTVSPFVAVGGSGSILTSSDGVTWTSSTSGTTKSLRAVNYSDSKFVAVGEAGTILTSTYGTTWTAQSSGTSNQLYGITYGDTSYTTSGIFVTVGESGTILTSSDGVTWTSRNWGQAKRLYDVIYAKNRFAAVGGFCSGCDTSVEAPNIYSFDANSWTSGTSIGTNSGELWGVTFGSTLFAVVGEGKVWTSSDLNTWISEPSGTTNTLFAITYGNSTYVAVGVSGTIITCSSSGCNSGGWTSRTSGTTNWLRAIIFGNNIFVVTGDSGTILTSLDGTTWTSRTSGTTNSIDGITSSE